MPRRVPAEDRARPLRLRDEVVARPFGHDLELGDLHADELALPLLDLAGDEDGVDVARVHPLDDRGVRVVERQDRKSTRLNSSHVAISYAVFCLKKKKTPSETSINVEKNETIREGM